MAVYIRGKRSGLNAALEGLQGGLQVGFGMGQQARRTQLAEQAHADEIAQAERQYELHKRASQRADEDQAAQRQAEADTRESTQALGEYAMQEPTTQAVGQGQGAFADLEAAQNAELARTADIAKRIKTPEAQRMFIQEQRAKMEDKQNQALIEHLKTRVQQQLASPLHSDGAELGHRGALRAQTYQDAMDILENATTPQSRAEAVRVVPEKIASQKKDDALELERLDTLSATTQAVQQEIAERDAQMAQLRTLGATIPGGLPPEVFMDLQAQRRAMNTTLALYRASGGEMTPAQLEQALAVARRARAPRPGAGGGGSRTGSDRLDSMIGRGAPSASDQRLTRKDAIEELRAEKLAANPGDMSQPTEDEIQARMRKITGSEVPDFRAPKGDSIIPGPAPDGDVRKQFEEAKAAGADRATLAGILKANGIDPSTPIQDAPTAQAKAFEKMIAEMSDAEKEQFLRFKAKGKKSPNDIPFGEYAKLQEKRRK